ncbi:MAG: four helix bundle protein [Gemmatimonadales bacterium]|nr:MAG: four helix bundle protein [Gemmatimonadales bacterium]
MAKRTGCRHEGTRACASPRYPQSVNKYKSLKAWQYSHQLVIRVLRSTDDAYHPRARALFDQVRRAAISVEANIVEGYALSTAPQFRRHLRIALSSAAEVECFCTIAKELSYLPDEAVTEIAGLASQTMRLLGGLLRTLR